MRKHVKLKMIVVIATITAVVVVGLLLHFRTTSAPNLSPRNVRMLVGGGGFMGYTLLEVNENHLNVIVLSMVWVQCYETGELGIGGLEPLDSALIDDFAEDFSSLGRWNVPRNLPIGILERGSIELSQEQLHNIWQKIDNVVQNYEEPPFFPNSAPLIRVIIDDEFYWGRYAWNDYLHYRSLRFRSQRDRGFLDTTDADLLRLTHHLTVLSPIQVR